MRKVHVFSYGIYKALEERFPGCRVHAGVIYEDGMETDFLAGDENLFDEEFTLKEEKSTTMMIAKMKMNMTTIT